MTDNVRQVPGRTHYRFMYLVLLSKKVAEFVGLVNDDQVPIEARRFEFPLRVLVPAELVGTADRRRVRGISLRSPKAPRASLVRISKRRSKRCPSSSCHCSTRFPGLTNADNSSPRASSSLINRAARSS
jgi:hypothetical protein